MVPKKIAAVKIALVILFLAGYKLKVQSQSASAINGQRPAILMAGISPKTLGPGRAFKINYNWDAQPMNADYKVWVHILNAKGNIVLHDDHNPPFPTRTTTWSGKFNYSRMIRLPDTLADGAYSIRAGLFGKASGRQPLVAGKGVKALADNGFEIGGFIVDKTAPAPPLDSDVPATLSLRGYRISFNDEFDGPLDVSALGSGTKWIAHTPYGGDFGDARFTDPQDGYPFSTTGGILTIEASKNNGAWRSGLLSSLDTGARGFSQQYGYFEMRAKFPQGPGTWPAFWLLSAKNIKDKKAMGFEVDIVEQYGREPDVLHSVLHWWYPDKKHNSVANQFVVEDMSKDFHNYGFMWTKEHMIWYFDGKELWRQPTPAEAHTPMYVLVNLAMGSGWPIHQTPNPSKMLVDYVRVYAKE